MTTEASRRVRSTSICLFLLCGISLVLGVVKGASIPYWSDELATVHIAEAPSWAEMMQRSRLADLNPPLEISMVRASFKLFGTNELAGRIPSILCFTLAIACMFLYLRRRVPTSFALFGALLPLYSEDISYYATEARPYAGLLAMLSLALLAYDSLLRSRPRAILWRILLALALAGALLSHIFGLLGVAAFLLAEAVRSWRTRRVDIATWIALLLPFACCVLYVPLIHGHSGEGAAHQLVYREASRPSLLKGLLLYHSILYKSVAPVLEVGVAILVLLHFYPRRPARAFADLKKEEWVLLLALLATPVALAAGLHVVASGSGFYPRYSLAMVIPGYILVTLFFAWRSEEHRLVGLALASLALLGVLFTFHEVPGEALQLAHRGLFAEPAGVASTGGATAIRPDLPLAVNDALRFMEADHRLHAKDSGAMVYVTDRGESLRLEHYNAAESVADMAKAFHLRSPVVPYPEFIAAHQQFLVLGQLDHRGWLLDKMLECHVPLELQGDYMFAGYEQQVWLATPGEPQKQSAEMAGCLQR